MLITRACSCPIGVWKYSALISSSSFLYSFCGRNVTGWFLSPKSKVKETSLLSEATLKATQYNGKWARKVLEEWQRRRQSTCAILEVVGEADLKCEDVQDLTVPLEHMWPNTLNFWLSKFVCEEAKKNRSDIHPIRFIC